MRIKYLSTKVFLVLITVIATPIVWAALAWPEWSAASPAEDNVVEAVSATDVSNVQAPSEVTPVVIHQVVVIPRYVEVEVSPAAGQPVTARSAPKQPAAPAPAPPSSSTPTQAVLPAAPKSDPVIQPQTAAAGGSNGGSTGSSSPAPPPPASNQNSNSSSGSSSGSSSSSSSSSTSSSSSSSSSSNSTTKGS
jgi:uncharacterized membrane protein YgcG